ncbi:MAG: TVP38/TMEM64 family protein [Bacteriovoracaceae bacterium]|nr:TVP38/TMEM64 family protein [Bacteriovoracaceae bacterium]
MKSKLIILFLIILFFSGFVYFDLSQFLTLEYIKDNQERFQIYYQQNQVSTLLIYMSIYIIATALSLPGATVLSLAGGALFGFTVALIIVSFASTIGATLSFLFSRYFLKGFVQEKFGDKLTTINEEFKKEGAFYLFTLRLIPVFPFFLINLLMGLTPIKTTTYFFVSQLGMLAGTAVYINAGLQLSKLDSLAGILSPSIIGSFALLGLFPLITKKIIASIKEKKGNKE